MALGFSPKLPQGYTALYYASARQNVNVNVIGVVRDYLPPKQSQGSDWMCSFSIKDESNTGNGDGLKVRFFRRREAELPAVQGSGDLVIIQNIKPKEMNGLRILISNYSTTCVVFPKSSIPEELPANIYQSKHIKVAGSPAPTLEELQYAVSLYNNADRSSFEVSAPSSHSTIPNSHENNSGSKVSRKKFSLIKDIKIDTFYDLVGQVSKIYPSNGCCELYLSDYTTNNLLFNYEWEHDTSEGHATDGDVYGHIPRSTRKNWQGPYGKMTLMVTLWDPHFEFARSTVKENDFVLLRNVLIRNKSGRFEGSLHMDKKYPSRIDISTLKDNDDRVKDVLRRKKEYSKILCARGQKHKRGDDEKSVSNKRGKRKRNQKQGKSRQNAASVDEKVEGSPLFSRLLLNKNIACTHPDVPPRSICSILSREITHTHTTPNHHDCILPFQNIRSRAIVRAVDFFPEKLEDFAVYHKANEFDVLEDNSDSENDKDTIMSDDSERDCSKDKWEWRFGLILEDASSHAPKPEDRDWIKVYVANEGAEFLLNMEAVDLRKDLKALSQLREKLFILWGDLEERQTQAQTQTRAPMARESTKRALTEIKANTRIIPLLHGKEPNPNDSKELPKQPPCTNPISQTPAFTCLLEEYGVQVPKQELEPVGGRGWTVDAETVNAEMVEQADAKGEGPIPTDKDGDDLPIREGRSEPEPGWVWVDKKGGSTIPTDRDGDGDDTQMVDERNEPEPARDWVGRRSEPEPEWEWQRCFQMFGTRIKF